MQGVRASQGGALKEGVDSLYTQDVTYEDVFEDEPAHPSIAYSEPTCQPRRAGCRYYSESGSGSCSGLGSGSGSALGGDQIGGGSEFEGTNLGSSDDINVED